MLLFLVLKNQTKLFHSPRQLSIKKVHCFKYLTTTRTGVADVGGIWTIVLKKMDKAGFGDQG